MPFPEGPDGQTQSFSIDPDDLPDPATLPPNPDPDEYDADGDDGEPWGDPTIPPEVP